MTFPDIDIDDVDMDDMDIDIDLDDMGDEGLSDADVALTELIVRLKTFPHFSELSEKSLKKIVVHIEEVYQGPGMPLVNPNETDNSFYIVEQGEAKRETFDSFGGLVCLRSMKRGNFFGHFSLIHDVPYSLSVVATAPTYLLKISKDKFQRLLKECPDFAAIFEQKIVRDIDFIERIQYLSFFEMLTQKELENVVSLVQVEQLPADTDLLATKKGSLHTVVISNGQMQVTNDNNSQIKKVSLSRGNFVSNIPTLTGVTVNITQPSTVFTINEDAAHDILDKIPRLGEVFERKDITEQFEKISLFNDFKPNDLHLLAWATSYASFPAHKYICRQGEVGTRYYIIYNGEFEVRALDGNGNKPPAGALRISVGAGEKKDGVESKKRYLLGERSVFFNQPYPVGLWTLDKTEMFFINSSDFDFLYRNNEGIEQYFEPEEQHIKQAFQYLKFRFPGKSDDEDVIYYTHRHWISFAFGLFTVPVPSFRGLRERSRGVSIESFLAVALFLTALVWLFIPSITGAATSFLAVLIGFLQGYIACVLLLLAFWVVWTYLDWRNDFLVITTKRVLRREQIIMLYEDQAETELDKIQSTIISVGLLGNLLGYSNITIKTASADGTIIFDRGPHPSQLYRWLSSLPILQRFLPKKPHSYAYDILNSLVLEQKGRGQFMSTQAEQSKLQASLRDKMKASLVDSWDVAKPAQPPKKQPRGVRKWLDAASKKRTQILDAIVPWRWGDIKPDPKKNIHVWRKHWTVLMKSSWDSIISTFIMAMLSIVYLSGYMTILDWFNVPSSFLIIINILIGLVCIAILARFWFECADWGNDLYILTPTHIIDVEKQPLLLSEKRNQADLDKIENVFFKQEGLWDNMFNIGDIVITTAGELPITFYRVGNPRDVQRQIFEQMQTAKSNVAQKASKAEDEKFTRWFDVYHNNFVNLGGC